ncbi:MULTISPECIES: universal stress protein [Variovorax]|jgi:nucleotide-binding universal stress UspA family protein|uniref:universal stress protein n=1 Tax=Variovorax TaxID=34072 RepID=UPI000C5890A8|nr:universal stress protein [Variovorax sp.]MBS74181.1 hypothetical protein [Variovorax sp.]
MFGKVLLAYDGSQTADLAFTRALQVAQEAHAPLHVVAVAWSPEVETHASLDKARDQCWEYLNLLRSKATAAQVVLELEVVEGNCSDQIVAAADRLEADLIVIGHRQRTLMQRLSEASLAKRVVDHAHCSVLIAR